MIRQAYDDLARLTNYLFKHKGVIPSVRKIGIVHTRAMDRENEKDPRAFCAVNDTAWLIYCTQSINYLPANARIGILLHEVSHLVNNFIGKREDEVNTDEWIVTAIPEAGYGYQSIAYHNPLLGKQVTAHDLETVGTAFLGRLGL